MFTLNKIIIGSHLYAAVGSAVVGGLLFIFSISIMQALSQMSAEAGMEAMQRINVTIVNPIFFLAFFGTGIAAIVIAINAFINLTRPGSGYTLAGALLYLFGVVVMTVIVHIPKNNALDAALPTDPDSVALWQDYLTSWTFWNHIRSAAAIGASLLLMLARGG